MKGIIIDENLPSKLNLPTGLLVRSTRAVGTNPTDGEIWGYAKARDFIILTKDADFSHRIAVSDPPPWVVHVRVGNMPLKQFIQQLQDVWPRIQEHLPEAKLVCLYRDHLEIVI